MKKKTKKKTRKKKKKNLNNKIGLVFLLSFLVILGLFSETVRTLPAGAFSEKLNNIPYEMPRLNSDLIEEKLFNKADYKKIKEEIVFDRIYKKEKKN